MERFTISGLPRDHVMSLIVTHPGHERLIAFAATTEVPQPDDIQRTFRFGQMEELRRPVHKQAFTLTAKRTDHVLTGRIVFEADGKPAAGARVVCQGNAIHVVADEEGRYRIEGIASGPLDLHVIAENTDAGPLETTIEIPAEPKEISHEIVLPRGLVLTGRVVDEATGRGVAKAKVDYVSTPRQGRASESHSGFRPQPSQRWSYAERLWFHERDRC